MWPAPLPQTPLRSRSWALPALSVVGLLSTACLTPAAAGDPPLVIQGVGVVDVIGGTVLSGQTVSVRDGRIERVTPAGDAPTPRGARVLDGAGKYLIPGLWDMHVHVWSPAAFPLYLANGVTTVRNTGGRLEEVLLWKEQLSRGVLFGPRMFICGPVLDGPEPVRPDHSIALSSPADAVAVVDRLQRAGVDFLKVYDRLSPEAFLAVAKEARKRGMRLAGHTPDAMTAEAASDGGLGSLEHLDGVEEELAAGRTPEQIAATFARNRTSQVPTLTIKEALAFFEEPEFQERLAARRAYLPQWQLDLLDSPQNPVRHRSAEDRGRARRTFGRLVAVLRAAQRADVPIMAGTDSDGAPLCVPGFSLHDELRLLVGAGLSGLEALRAATIVPARWMGVEDTTGSVTEGKAADLVLVRADPLVTIGNAARIDAVIVRGQLLDRAQLDALLAGARAARR